jgi:outer membrane protein assembly factor BamB
MVRFLVSISFVLAAVAAGCASNSSFAANPAPSALGAFLGETRRSVNWSEFGFIPSGGRFNPHERMLSSRNAHRLHKRWSFFTGCSGSQCGSSSAAVVNGTVYVGGYDGNLYALKAATGAKLWSFLTAGDVRSSPAVANGVIYDGSGDDNVYAIDAARGTKLWSYTTGNQLFASPTVVNGVVYVGSGNGYVYAFGL